MNTNKYERTMSGPVSLVVWLAGHKGKLALVEVNSHLEDRLDTMVSIEFPKSVSLSMTGCAGKGCRSHGTWTALGLKWILFRLTNPPCVFSTYERGVTSPKTSPLFTTVMVTWPDVNKLSRCEGGYVSAGSFVIVNFSFSSPAQMLVTDYGYWFHRLAQRWFRYWLESKSYPEAGCSYGPGDQWGGLIYLTSCWPPWRQLQHYR